MKTLARLIRNLFTTTASGRRAFPGPTLKAIQAAIADGETRHRAEVRLIVEPALAAGAVLNGHTARQRARELFSLYRVWDTEENCGVLIYVNLAERKVEIIADRGVGRAIGAPEWQAVCRIMTEGFAQGKFHDSAIAGLVQLNQILATHFPATGSRHNQLSDRPIVL